LPVIRIDLKRFAKMVGADRRKVLDRLPYIGLDIESVDKDSVRVEYSPNRPDFGTDFGIARALRGLLGKEVGLPQFKTRKSGIKVSFDRRLSKVRPFLACATATGLDLDDEDVRQIISLQEDLHNGLGRRRKVVSIGLHDLDAVKPPLWYKAVQPSFSFVPLGSTKESTMGQILSGSPEGRAYGPVLGKGDLLPVFLDAAGTVLSFPPIINGAETKVTSKTRRMLIDVTSTNKKAGDDVLAIVATTLAEAGAKLGTVSIDYPKGRRTTPDLDPQQLPLDKHLIRSLLGLELTSKQISQSLARSRMAVSGNMALGPRYRVDLLHPVDIAEEVALGYGTDRIGPIYPPSKHPGSFNRFEQFLDSASTVLAGSGMIEMMSYELADEKSLYSNFGRSSDKKVSVQDPKTIDHSILRDALIPTLMAQLSGNVKSDYPQRVFEIGRVYARTGEGVSETWHLGCLVAHSQATYTEAKMYLEAACRILTGKEATAKSAEHWAFSPGRSASVELDDKRLGYVGEMKPESLDAFGVKVPVSGFEIDVSGLFERLK
jgi:phenylalanyl-tRNA synthetase beta chain